MKELSLRADEFIQTGGGAAAEAFGRLGYSAERLKAKLKDPSALFTEIIGKLGQLDRAAQIRISDELFGGSGGEKFVQLIDKGADGIRDTIREAHQLGAVMADEVIERAEELDKRFQAITTSVGTGLKTAIVESAWAMQQFISTFQGWWERYERRLAIVEAGNLAGSLAGTLAPGPAGRTTPKTSRLPAAEAAMPSPEDLSSGYMKAYRDELELTNKARAIAAEQERILADAAKRGIQITKEQAEALAREKVSRDENEASSKKLTSERDRAARVAENEARKIREVIAELEEELRLVGASETQKQISAALRRANVDAASREGQQIARLVTQIEAETSALEKQKKAQEARNDAISSMFDMGADALTSIVDGSTKAEDAVKKLAVQLALAAAQAALLGTGPLAGLFGGLFGGGSSGGGIPWSQDIFRESGGPVKRGQPYIVGEKRPELFVPDQNGSIVPFVPEVPTVASSAGDGGISIAYAPTYNVTGSGPELDRLRSEMARDRQQFKGRVIEAVADARRRHIDV
jgi:hypothetical protein